MVAKLIQYENEYQFNERKEKYENSFDMIAFNKSKPEDLILQVKRLSKENAIAESDYNGLNNSTRTVYLF